MIVAAAARDLARHLRRRLADHAHPRPPDHPPRPARGFAAETVGAGVLYTTAFVFQAPISTTHIITSAIMGAGATKRFSAVRWGVARTIVTAWVLTFPAAGLVAAVCYGVAAPLPALTRAGGESAWRAGQRVP